MVRTCVRLSVGFGTVTLRITLLISGKTDAGSRITVPLLKISMKNFRSDLTN